ncbi:eukaryotic translation initiation factor 2-alpha kinase [Exophiala viscosa]|uniref:eukaryotic translation initiation factor 2-alpha kinase n=1 Tax=Exophiala viscosa TaxID=2486360 RepID=UPI002195F0AD|nr:eukaryotic translation initiation factor 2-alpha kinase [Exophiala viscosa]
MPAKKKTKPLQPQASKSEPEPTLAAPPSFGQSHRSFEEEIAEYPEVQRNEFLTTRAIYPDEFERVRGRKDAWQAKENLAFQVRIGPLEDRAYFVKLIFEFPRAYPKVLPKIDILDIQPKDPEIRQHIEHIISTYPKQYQGSESVYEVNTAIMDFLDQVSLDKAAKKADKSLEEERVAKEALTKKQLEEQEERARKQQAEQVEKDETLLESQVSHEKQRRLKTTLSRKSTGEDNADLYDVPEDPVRFDQSMTLRDIGTTMPFKFKAVVGRSVILKRKDKKVMIVAPRVDTERVQAPQLLLKDIYLPESIAPKGELQKCMEIVEEDLESSKQHHHLNVVDLINYKIEHMNLEDGTGQWKLSVLSEYANGKSLTDLLDYAEALSAAKIRSWTRQLADALVFFDQQGYVHPAVHAGNVMLFRSPTGGITVKLSDGYGTQLRELVMAASETSAPADNWTAPELETSKPQRTNKTCIWELGVVIMQMALGKDVKEMYLDPTNVLVGCAFHDSIERLLGEMFASRPGSRPSAFELTRKAFFFEERIPIFQNHSPTLPNTPNLRRRYSGKSGVSRYESEWEEIECLGRGGFGAVFRARLKLDGQIYAVKKIPSRSIKKLEEILAEVTLLAKLNHQYVVRYFTAWYENEQDNRIEDLPPPAIRPKSARQPLPLSTGHDFMEPSVYRHQGPEFSDDDGDMFGYQPPPPIDEEDGYDDDPFGSDPEPDREQDEQPSDPFAVRYPTSHDLQQDNADDDPFASAESPPNSAVPVRTRSPPRSEVTSLYIQMEFCEGQDLRSRIAQGLYKDVDAVWRLFRRIVEGLAYVHALGVVHRDLKPENIFLDALDNPKIGDFGLATAGQAVSKAQASAPGMTTTNKSTGVGTRGYTAPELMSHGSKYDARADMYSLGVMFYEMCYPFRTGTERAEGMQYLAVNPPILPDFFKEDIHQTQGEVILELTNRDQELRPTARQLLDGGKVPEPLEEEKFQRHIDRLAEQRPEEYQSVVNKFFNKPNSTVSSLAWEDTSGKSMTTVDPVLWTSTCEHLKEIFRRHGAVETARQGMVPRAGFTTNPAVFLDTSGLVVQLPEDLTLPFARTLGQSPHNYAKTYCFGTVYRATAPGVQPRHVPEVDFDFVSHGDNDLSIKEAEVIKVLDEILNEFPVLAARKWAIYVTHTDLMDIILDFCRIKAHESRKVKQALSHLNIGDKTWPDIRKELRSSAMNIAETSVTDLARFNLEGDVDKIRNRLTQLFGEGEHLSKTLPLLARLDEVLQYLKRMNVRTEILVAPLRNVLNSEHLYRGSLLFQCMDKSFRRALAVGGRYDALIQEFQTKSERGSTRSVGFRLNVVDLVAYVRGPKAAKHTTDARQAPRCFCDVLVTSFDAATLKSGCVELVSSLWSAGLSAELSEEFRSLEELERAYKDANFWLVIVRGGAGDRGLKVRSPSRSEYEVKAVELVSFLRLNMAKNR